MPDPRPVRPAIDATSDLSDASAGGVPSSMSVSTPTGHETYGGGEAASTAHTPTRIGEYAVLGELGRGGMGVVYRAEDSRLRREVALKVMLSQFAQNSQAKARFVREARAQAKVEHDHVAAIHRVDDHDGLPYIVMPLLKGMTLQAALKANPADDTVRLVYADWLDEHDDLRGPWLRDGMCVGLGGFGLASGVRQSGGLGEPGRE